MVSDASIRRRELFDEGWKFVLGDPVGAAEVGFDDASWRALDLPHDWSIEGPAPFDADLPSGSGGGYVRGGVGWYRKTFVLPPTALGKTLWIEFDGVYKNADVYLNGHHLGFHPYGYTSFYYDLTPHLDPSGANTLAVRVDDSDLPDSRFFTGAGIYRHVWLSRMAALHVGHWGTFAWTPQFAPEFVRVEVFTTVRNEADTPRLCTLATHILDAEGHVAGERESLHAVPARGEHTFAQRIFVDQPRRWALDDPYLYTVRNRVQDGEQVLDEYAIPLGVREVCFDVDRGFLLNGQPTKLNGVCLHHDGGCVGAAVPERVWERRLETLKAMGCNAIRSSHYPPAPEFLDLCDRLGFLVMDEAFDEWKSGKVLYSYHVWFDEWAERDLVSMLQRDRNHPSIVLWSVGNEIHEQARPEGPEMLRRLAAIVHREDPGRPVTSACDYMSAPVPTLPEFAAGLDVVGYNYVDRWGELRERYYADDRERFPQRKMIGSENSSLGGIRGDYALTGAREWFRPYHSRMVEPEQLWKFTKMHSYVAGDFMWTGIDYLGEARWPSKNASSGVIDLCGFPKDGYYFYQSQWTRQPMLHVLPHWTWPGREGQVIPVICYTNCEQVELFLNGRSFGTKAYALPRPGMPGVLKAVGQRDGEVVCVQEIVTAGPAAQLCLGVDRGEMVADGWDVAHLTVRVLDDAGQMAPTADSLIAFQVEGPGHIIGVDNGNPSSHEPFHASQRQAFNGLCLAIVQGTRTPGMVRIVASAAGLAPGIVTLMSTQP